MKPHALQPRVEMVLTQAIVRKESKAVLAGMNPTDLKRSIGTAVESVVDDVNKHSKKVSTNAEIRQVGAISGALRAA